MSAKTHVLLLGGHKATIDGASPPDVAAELRDAEPDADGLVYIQAPGAEPNRVAVRRDAVVALISPRSATTHFGPASEEAAEADLSEEAEAFDLSGEPPRYGLPYEEAEMLRHLLEYKRDRRRQPRDPWIVQLAAETGRTPASVCQRIGNISAVDTSTDAVGLLGGSGLRGGDHCRHPVIQALWDRYGHLSIAALEAEIRARGGATLETLYSAEDYPGDRDAAGRVRNGRAKLLALIERDAAESAD